jgi:hypothetical protein
MVLACLRVQLMNGLGPDPGTCTVPASLRIVAWKIRRIRIHQARSPEAFPEGDFKAQTAVCIHAHLTSTNSRVKNQRNIRCNRLNAEIAFGVEGIWGCRKMLISTTRNLVPDPLRQAGTIKQAGSSY